ncbi:MAG: hypothetical protein WD738_08815 [Pirellulales bacterium]
MILTPYGQIPSSAFRNALRTLITLGVLLAFSEIAQAGVLFFNSDLAFDAAVDLADYPFLGREDFEGSTLTAPGNANINDPLTQGVPNGFYPSGLTQPMRVQTNTLNASPTVPSPGSIMLLVPAGSRNSVSDVVVPASSAVSFDWLMLEPRIKAVGLNPIILHEGGLAELKVYNQSNQLLGSFQTLADAAATNFVGVLATGTDRIGRINFLGLSGFGRAAGDNADLYFPEPSTAVMVAVAIALGGLNCRRRNPR